MAKDTTENKTTCNAETRGENLSTGIRVNMSDNGSCRLSGGNRVGTRRCGRGNEGKLTG